RAPADSHFLTAVFTKNGEFARSAFGFGTSKWMEGGRTLLWRASAALASPAAPAAALRWPIWDFTEPRATDCLRARAPKAAVRTPTSTASPTGVEVPWASM